MRCRRVRGAAMQHDLALSARRDARLTEAKAQDIWTVAERLEISGLTRAGREWTGPCPICGGSDRFSINLQKRLFQCRQGCGRGDVINLVRMVRRLNLPDAIDWLLGPLQDLPEAERVERQQASARNQADLDRKAARERQDAIRAARKIWDAGQDAEGTLVRDYLALRGITPSVLPRIPGSIRFHPALPYMVAVDGGKSWIEVHRGPAMIAAIVQPDRVMTALHRTWIDLDQPRGKAAISGPDGAALKVKKGLGSKKGGVIRLQTPREFDTIVMGEGIETTLTALAAGVYPDAAYWCAVDLGNIAGRRQNGRGLKYAGLPDMSDARAWRPPPWLRRLILIEDGDSEARITRAQLEAGARRAMVLVPGLEAKIVPCPAGRDLNDLLLED